MSDKFAKLLIIPTDNRPVSYDLPLSTAKLINSTDVVMPPKEYLSSLDNEGNYDGLINWLNNTLKNQTFDIIIVSLDTIAYGGLIPSRRTKLTFDEIKSRINNFCDLIKNIDNKPKIYAFSSIMRISNSNINEEEKSYWNQYGKAIFEFSYLSHKLLANYDENNEKKVTQLAKEIPFEIIDDYLNTRRRNYEINLFYLDIIKQGLFECLIFSQDDSAEYGFNVEEAGLLNSYIQKEKLVENTFVKTGADELATDMVARAIGDFYKKNVSFQINFFKNDADKIISRYEGFSIRESILSQINTCKAEITINNPDIQLLINAPNKIQNELCLNIFEDEQNNIQADEITNFIQNNTDKKFAVIDIKNANGADNYLIEKLLPVININNLYGFAAWNTTSNTLGTVISIAKVRFIAENINEFDENIFKKLMTVRFLDDWAYQSNVRQIIRKENNNSLLKEKMLPFENKIKSIFNINSEINYSFPWNRTFEAEIQL